MAVTLTAATIAAIDTFHATPGDVQNTEIRTALTAARADLVTLDAALTTAIVTAEVAISAAEIVGTAAGDLGNSGGVEIVAAPGAGFALQFIDAVIIYDFDTAAYTGGAGDDLGFFINSVAVSPSIATADLITKAGDTVISMSPLATDYVLGVNSNINLACTAVTNPGTAAGVIRVKVRYRTITTGL